jgi:hypothetical protein
MNPQQYFFVYAIVRYRHLSTSIAYFRPVGPFGIINEDLPFFFLRLFQACSAALAANLLDLEANVRKPS